MFLPSLMNWIGKASNTLIIKNGEKSVCGAFR